MLDFFGYQSSLVSAMFEKEDNCNNCVTGNAQ